MTQAGARPATIDVGIIGYPLGHTISPAFHQAAFDALKLPYRYTAWRTPPEELAARVQSFRRQGHAGSNVTVPHKEAVIPLLDEVDPIARRIGAVNTIVNRDGRLFGYNTDAPGFIRSLRDDAGFDPKGKSALVLGAGGAAKGIACALADAGLSVLALANRTAERAQRLADTLTTQSTGTYVQLLTWGISGRFDLIVNTTTLGMQGEPGAQESPLPTQLIPATALVCDLVYVPVETPFLRAAREAGAKTLGGLPMLIYQGAYSFELWTGRQPPLDVMFAAARAALGIR